MVNKGGDRPSGENGSSLKRRVDDDSHHQPVKRSRVSRACDQCRASRERCDGAQPICQTCSTQQRACSYKEQPKKRGIQPNYIRTLEVTLAWVFQHFPEVENVLSTGLPYENDSARSLIGAKDPSATEELHIAWRHCLINKQIEQLLSGSIVEANGSLVSGSAPAAAATDSSEEATNIHITYRSPPLSVPMEHDHTVNTDLTNTSPREIQTQLANVGPGMNMYQLPQNAFGLLEYYFTFTHSWLPMTEKHSMLRILYSYPSGGLPFEQVDTAEHAELWSIMALAATQVNDNTATDDTERIRKHADGLLPSSDTPYEVPHIRALILRALDDFQRHQVLSAWLRLGSAVRLLHLFRLLENLGKTAKWCRHVHLAAFVIESTLARRLQTVGHFRTDYVRGVGFIDEDGLDEWEPWSDPLKASAAGLVVKAPTKAFSTLNELVRHHMRLIDDNPVIPGVHSEASDLDGSIVCILLRNAMSKQERVQPSDLVAACCNSMKNKTLDWTCVARPELHGTWDLPDDFPTVSEINAQPTQSASQQSYPFMAMPNDAGQTGSDYAQTEMDVMWPTFQSPLQLANTPTGVSNASLDVLDELVTLERQESAQNPHFMQNLGFPDLDLAEFFGADYRPTES